MVSVDKHLINIIILFQHDKEVLSGYITLRRHMRNITRKDVNTFY